MIDRGSVNSTRFRDASLDLISPVNVRLLLNAPEYLITCLNDTSQILIAIIFTDSCHSQNYRINTLYPSNLQ